MTVPGPVGGGDLHGATDGAATVVAVELRRVAFALRHAHVAAHGAEHRREVLVARVERADGTAGWGECSALAAPGYTAEHLDGAWAALRDHLAPALLAGAPGTDHSQPMASAALADAVLDAHLRAVGEGLARALATATGRDPGATAPAVRSVAVIGIEADIDTLLARVGAEPGGVKLKVRPGWAREPLAAVRRAWPDRWLAADANGSFTTDDLGGLRALDGMGLAYLEQPTADLAGCAACAAALATPVALDEVVASTADARRAHADGALGVLNVKPARVGGVAAAAALAAWADDHGVPAFVGGMLESGIGRAASLAVAAQPTLSLPTDLGPSARYVEHDVAGPLVADASGGVVVPTGPGIGVIPDGARLDEATTDRLVLHR